MSRQAIVKAVSVHPNLALRNLFGNMSFSSSIRTNNYPHDIQDAQVRNLYLPTWSMLPVNIKSGPGSLKNAVSSVMDQATRLIQQGTPLELIVETQPNIAALFDEEEFKRSGILSQWSASMVHSAFLQGRHIAE